MTGPPPTKRNPYFGVTKIAENGEAFISSFPEIFALLYWNPQETTKRYPLETEVFDSHKKG